MFTSCTGTLRCTRARRARFKRSTAEGEETYPWLHPHPAHKRVRLRLSGARLSPQVILAHKGVWSYMLISHFIRNIILSDAFGLRTASVHVMESTRCFFEILVHVDMMSAVYSCYEFLALDSSSWLAGVTLDVVFCCFSSFAKRFTVLCI